MKSNGGGHGWILIGVCQMVEDIGYWLVYVKLCIQRITTTFGRCESEMQKNTYEKKYER